MSMSTPMSGVGAAEQKRPRPRVENAGMMKERMMNG